MDASGQMPEKHIASKQIIDVYYPRVLVQSTHGLCVPTYKHICMYVHIGIDVQVV
jgi:hypothetical protein